MLCPLAEGLLRPSTTLPQPSSFNVSMDEARDIPIFVGSLLPSMDELECARPKSLLRRCGSELLLVPFSITLGGLGRLLFFFRRSLMAWSREFDEVVGLSSLVSAAGSGKVGGGDEIVLTGETQNPGAKPESSGGLSSCIATSSPCV